MVFIDESFIVSFSNGIFLCFTGELFTVFHVDELFCFLCLVVEASQRAKKSLTRPTSDQMDVRSTRRNRAPLVPLSPTTLEARHHKTDSSSIPQKEPMVQVTTTSNSRNSSRESPALSSGCQATGMTDSKTDSAAADGLMEAGASAVEMSSGVSPQESTFPQQQPMHQSPSGGHLYHPCVGSLKSHSCGGGNAESPVLCVGSPVCHQKRQRSHHRSKQCTSSNTAQSGAVPSAPMDGAAPDWQR